jgi:hypothetical protein
MDSDEELEKLSAQALDFVRLELLTGCAYCGKRLVGYNNAGCYLLPGTKIVRIKNDAAYAVCGGPHEGM